MRPVGFLVWFGLKFFFPLMYQKNCFSKYRKKSKINQKNGENS